MFFLFGKSVRTKMPILQANNPWPQQQEKEKKECGRKYNMGDFSL